MIKWAKRGRDLVITISGEFDLCMVPEFREKVDNLIDSNESAKRLVLDLKDVSFIDSSGLGVIMGRHKKMLARGGALAIQSPSHNAFKALISCGVDQIIEIFEDQDHDPRKSAKEVV